MKVVSLISTLFWLFTGLAWALPMASSLEDGDLEDMMMQIIDVNNEAYELYDFIDDSSLALESMGSSDLFKRDVKTVESLLETVNRSGIIFDVLDEIAGHPRRISLLANATARLIKSLGGSLDLSLLEEIGAGLNITNIYDIVKDSGLVTSILDGILLDDNYRPVLVKLITRIAEANKSLIAYIIDDVFAAAKKKRADDDDDDDNSNGGTLETFAINIVSTVLSSRLFTNIVNDTVVALNDTGIAVYIVKRAIADESYQNMTVELFEDLKDTGVIKIDNSTLSNLNITKIASSVLDNPTMILRLTRAALSGDLNLRQTFGKYAGAIKDIVKDLEDDGLFRDLNNYVFSTDSNRRTSSRLAVSSSSARSSTSSRSNRNQQVKAAGSNSKSSATTSSDSGSYNIHQQSKTPIIKALIYFQSVLFGGALLLF